ncbi:MAG: hypothetical protein AABX54_00915 [Nanoarchaeota archaeon]
MALNIFSSATGSEMNLINQIRDLPYLSDLSYSVFLSVLIGVLVIVLILIILLIILIKRSSRHRKEKSLLMIKAKNLVQEARERRMSEAQIREMFRDKNWREKDIDKLMK